MLPLPHPPQVLSSKYLAVLPLLVTDASAVVCSIPACTADNQTEPGDRKSSIPDFYHLDIVQVVFCVALVYLDTLFWMFGLIVLLTVSTLYPVTLSQNKSR